VSPPETPLDETTYTLTHLADVQPATALLAAAVVVALFDLGRYGNDVVGAIPAGVPTPRLPDVHAASVAEVLVPAVGLTMVAHTDNVLTGRALASRRRERVDANQEFLALGAANLTAGLMQGFPVSSSGSRAVLGDALGSRTQLYSLVTLVVVLVTMFLLGPVLSRLPARRARRGGRPCGRPARRRRRAAADGPAPSQRARDSLATTAAVLLLGVLPGVRDRGDGAGEAGPPRRAEHRRDPRPCREDRIFMTLPTAVRAYVEEYAARHGTPPAGPEVPPPP
jgi:SulP family sulfate permease